MRKIPNNTEVIVLSIALVSLVLAAIFFPYSHYLNDYGNPDFYWNDSLADQSSFDNIPDCYVCADTGKVTLFVTDSCKSVDIALVNGKGRKVSAEGIKALSTMFPCYSDSLLAKNPDTIITPIIEACKIIPNGGVYCCSRGCKPAWVKNDEFPHYSFDSSMLDSILRTDEETFNALLDKYDNVYALLEGEKIISPVVYGYADRQNGKLMLGETTLDTAEITDRLYQQFYDSLCGGCGYVIYKGSICKIESLRDEYASLAWLTWCNIDDISVFEARKLDNERSGTWVIFIVIFLNTLLMFCLYRLTNGKRKDNARDMGNENDFAFQSEKIDAFHKVSQSGIAKLINDDDGNPDNEKLNQLSVLVDLFKDLSECYDEASLRKFLASSKLSGFVATFEMAKAGINFLTVIDNRNARLERLEKEIARYREYEALYDKIKGCNNGDELNAVFRKYRLKTIVTPKTICESAKLGIETFRSFVDKVDDQKTRTVLNKLLGDFAHYKSICETLKTDKNVDSKELNRRVQEMKANSDNLIEVKRQLKAQTERCEKYSSELSACKTQLAKATEYVVKYQETCEFFNQMYDLFVGEFIDNREKNKDKGWFFEHVLNIAFHTTDFIAHVKEPAKSIEYFKNYCWMKSGFVVTDKNKFEYKDSRYSTEYSNLLYEWLGEVNVEHTKFLISKYLLKP